MPILQNFHHQLSGSSESSKKLVFLHGLMGYGANWRRIVKDFEKDFHVLYYDQRGHGRSISPTTGYAPEDFSQDLLQILDELGWQEIYLVGHSMGGRVAATFTHLNPQRVCRLVIEDIGPDANPEAIRRIEELVDDVPAPFSSKKEAKEYFMNDFVRQFSERPKVRVLGQFLYSNITENESGEFDWKFDKEAMRQCVVEGRKRERFKEFSEISAKTLLIRGENSEELSQEVYEKVLEENQAYFSGVVVPDAGHWIHYEQPETFSQLVKDFFLAAVAPTT